MFERVSDYLYLLKTKTIDIEIYSNESLIKKTEEDDTLKQAQDITTLPGLKKVILMPDAHQGYGFPIGTIAAFDVEDGVISPGGVGYDINCGVRAINTGLKFEDIKDLSETLVYALYSQIPKGAVSDKAIYYLNDKQLLKVTFEGASFAIKNGFGFQSDLEAIEDGGVLDVETDSLTQAAKDRGKTELGSLGSGNHFLELDYVSEIFDKQLAMQFGVDARDVIIQIHTGSRGLGHQTAIDYLRIFREKADKDKLTFPNKELVSLPLDTPQASSYFNAMNQAANYAFANRQILGAKACQTIEMVLKKPVKCSLIYDIAHNIAKLEKHSIDGQNKTLIVHRKGATRAICANHPSLKKTRFFNSGHPVLIPGSMGSASYICVAQSKAKDTLYSVCHGSGRLLGRRAAIKKLKGTDFVTQLKKEGILILSDSKKGILEEAPSAYKDIDLVVSIVEKAGLVTKVAKLKPFGVIKG